MMRRKSFLAFLPLVIFLVVPVTLAQNRVQLKPADNAIRSQQPAKAQMENARIVQLPDLMVENIWLDTSCKINLRLKNTGGPIPDAEHQTSQVRVQIQSLMNFLPLILLDPAGILKKPGGQISCNTRIPMKVTGKVIVMADYNKRIKETGTGESNNEQASQQTPQCSAQTKTLKNDARPSFADPASKGTTMKLTPGSALPPLPKGMNADSTPFSISILSPTKNSSWIIGKQLQVRWTAEPRPKPFHIFLLQKPNDKTAAAIIAQFKTFMPDQQGIFTENWTIPSHVKTGGYLIKIVNIEDPSIFSVSEPFKINDHGLVLSTIPVTSIDPPVKAFLVYRPDATDTPLRGKPFLIAWEYLPSVLKNQGLYNAVHNQVRILLKNEKGQNKLTISTNALNNPPIYDQGTIQNSGSSFSWIVPDDIADGHYVARVETVDGRFYGESKPFIVWTPSVFQIQKKGGNTPLGAANDKLEEFPAKPKGTPVEVKNFKLLSVTPYLTHKGMYQLDLVAEVDANTDFQFGDNLQDPVLGHVTVKSEIIVDLKWGKPFIQVSSAIDFANKLGPRIYEYNAYCPQYAYPIGVFKKGKNTVKFIFKSFDKPYLGPIKATWPMIVYKDGIKTTYNICSAERDLYGKVRMSLFTQKYGRIDGDFQYFTVHEPRIVVDGVIMPLPCKE